MSVLDTDEPLPEDDEFGSGPESRPIEDDSKPSPRDYLSEAEVTLQTLYYPGARMDLGPFEIFAGSAKLTRVIYADYGIDESSAGSLIKSIARWKCTSFQKLNPANFGVDSWDAFWPDDPASLRHRQPANAFGCTAHLSNELGHEVEFTYFGTEGHQTLEVLIRCRLKPSTIVLQDHGFGLGWARFGGDSLMYRLARDLRALPRFLLIAAKTRTWPGYHQVTNLVRMPNGYQSALFKLDL